jgi:multidrug efflux pump subunit AcrB
MAANPNMRLVHLDWGDRTPSLHLAFDQERLRLIGLTPKEAAQQLQAYLNGTPATQVRENLRAVDVLLRSPGPERRSLAEIGDLTLATKDGRQVPVSQVARLESRTEDAVLKRYNRETYIRVQGDVLDGRQPPDIHAQVSRASHRSRPSSRRATASTRRARWRRARRRCCPWWRCSRSC